MSSDSRRVYILRVASHILSLNLVEEKLPNVQALQNFCDTTATLLVISRVDQKGHVDVSNEISGNKQALFRVIFYKNRPIPLSADGYKTDISVITTHQNATETFLGSIQQVFSKALEPNTNGSKNKQLFGLIHELEENLQTAVGGSTDSAKGITSLEDEINQWLRSAQNNKDPGNYSEALEPLAEQYNAIKNNLDSSFVLDDLFGFVEAAEESVDTLWNAVDHPYPQKRMKQLIEIIGEQLYQFIVARIQPVSELWRSKTSPEALRSSIALVDQWIDAVELLTAKSWPSNPLNEWKGGPMSMEFCVGFQKRLEEIFSLRTLPDQLVGLLRDSSILPQIHSSIESAMRNFNPCVYSLTEADQTQWRTRLNSAEKGIDGLMERAIPELRVRLQPSQADLNGVLEDMYNFRNFLNRKSVMERMQVEREALISRLLEYLQVQRKEYNDYVRNSAHAIGKFLTEIASKIIWIRSHVVQAEKMKRNSEPLLSDLPGYKKLVQALDSHLEELRAAESESFDSWCRDMISHTGDDNDSIALQTAGRLMILERERGLLNVSYSDRLARLLSEVRQLQSLGFQIPTKIMNFVQVGQKYYQYGIVLKQVAHFYNTIEQQMLPCQQSMMLEEALAFERLVLPSAKPNEYSAVNITWDNPERLKAYIEKLKEAAQKLTDHNRRLRRSHAEIGDLVVELLHIDLLKEEDKWDKKLLSIRQKFADEERYVTQKQNMRAWAVHWDRQLYKTLQLQFQWGLESLQHQIPTIHAQLVMREQTLQLRPPIEELKSSYYKEVKKFLSIPQRFRGIQNISKESSLFVIMVKRNATRFHHIYEQSEQLFQQLHSIDSQFEEWIALAQVNFEDLIERNFQKAPDWEAQLKHLKAKQRDVEKVPTEIQLGCIKVAANPLKRAFEDVLKRIYDALRWTLKQSITGSLQNIEQTLTEGIEKLSNLPQTLDEVAEANQNQVNLSRSNKQVREQMHIIDEKNTLLRTIFAGGQGVENITAIKEQYERFQTLLEGHELVMKEQVDTMKSNVVTRVAKLNADLEKLFELWNQFKPKAEILASDDRLALVKAVEFVREKRAQFEELSQRKEKIVNDCESFEVEVPDFPFFEEMRADLESYEANYLLYENFSNESDKLGEQEWILFRSKTYLFDEFLQQWMEKLKGLPATPVSVRLQKDIDDMKEFSACLKFCRGEVLSTDHWLEMFRLLKLPRGTTLEKLTFGDLLKVQHNIVQNVEQLKALNLRAQGEVTMREAIQELEVWAAQAEFSLADYKHSNGSVIKIVKEWKNVVNQVKDNQALLQSLKNSPYYNQFKDQTSIWEKRITDLDIYLHSLNDIQRKWVYLEPIFGRGSLPAEAARFNRIDVEFRAILADISKDSRLIALCSRVSMGKSLEQIADQLNRCQRSLNDFLEEKRTAFPRFYFLGDDDLLEILGQSTNPAIIQSHLKKLFQGVDKVIFDSNNENIVSVISSEGEKVQLNRIVRIVPKVETWLAQLNDEIKSTLRKLVAECLQERTLNPTKYPSQILCLAEQVRFCTDAELCLNDNDSANKLTAYKQQLNEQLEQFSRTIVEERILQLKLKALILDLVHHIDIVEQLLGTDNRSPNCWTWQKQLRFYFQAGNIMAKQAGSEIQYTYEYQGNAENLVHTPLTDKCYLTLTQALFMGLGGNPYGPAGTGKTESVKALARLLGRQVLVFNCDEGIDVQSIGRIFVGLVQCGAWGCFDEFNRLEKNVLSAVSSQIQSIQDAIRSRSGQCHLEGHHRPVIVDLNSALFVTLNPAGKGYGGRQRLPDNLKQLFRPIVMSIPDNERIAVTLLFSEGYKQAKELAKKLVTTFSLSKEMLSAQQHYDWGLRALKTVLKGCADVMINIRKQDQNASISAEREVEIVVQTLQLNTLSKLTFADSERFQNLIDDIFPGVNKKIAQFESLSNGLKAAAEKLRITITDRQTKKVFELHEQLRQRTGVVIVGPTGAGKSTLWKILQEVLGHVGQHITAFTINPKSMPRNRLLGSMDLDTREWSDGILTSASREAVKDTSKPVWIICDGDIDPEWIEALNSVLDDNKLLTMPSGERIQFGDNVNFIFETDDLTHASPATISRMGMIFISGEEMDELELVRNFVVRNKDILPVQYSEWVQGPLIEAYEWLQGRYTRDMAVCNVAVIKNVLSQVRGASTKNQFLVGLLRGLWPYVDSEHGKTLVEQVILLGQSHLHGISPLNVYCDHRTDSLISFTDDYGIEVHIDELKRLDRKPFIWTATAQAAKDIIQTWLAYGSEGQRESFIVVGDDGCGKEQLLCSCFETDHKSSVATMHCSAQTNAEHLEQLLLENCVQVSSPNGRILRPKEKENLIVYLKSPNLVKPDKYGTSSLIAFVQQMLAYKGYYGKNLDWIGLENIQIVVSVSTALGMERFSLPARLMSKLRLLKVEPSTQEELVAIYTVYLSSILKETTSRPQIESLSSQIVHTFEKIKSVFRAGEQFHYTFTPIDLTNWVCSLMRHHLEQEGGKNQNLYRAVTYEACRIFRDKLVNTEHKARFDSILGEFFSTYNRDEDSVYCSDLTPLNPASSQDAGKALHLLSRKDYIAQLEKCIVRYEFDMASFGQVLSDEIVELCLITDRALTMPGGSLLIAGRSGMGHSSVAKLVAHMHQLRQICPKVSSTYSMKHFGNDLKEAMKWAAIENEQVVLIVEDYQLLNDSFLQCLNSIIASGNAPGLFTAQEFDQIANSLRNIALQDAFEGSINSYFSYKVRQNLHVIVVMDVTHKGFSSRIASNPSLYKHCGVVWREDWDRDATLHQITFLTLKKASIETSSDFQKLFAHVFDQAPPETKIPAKFIAFLHNFTLITSKKKDGVQSRLKRLKMGVDKLTETRTSVAKMQKKAEKKRRVLAEKQGEADRALLAITQSMTGANEQKSNMESLKAATQEENVKIEEQKRLIDQQLKEVEPILKQAREAVGSIKSESLSEIRSLRAPPETIRDILQAVLLFMGILDNSWESMRKFLAKSGVKEEIINFDAHRITPDVVKKIEALIKSKAASFDPKNAKRASVAAAPLATWISANLAYAKIIERIAPLENEKQTLVRNLENAEKEVEDLSKGLSTIGKKVEELKANFELSMKDATQIKIDLDREEATITVASTLVDRLRGEYDRWLEQIKTLEEEFQQMERCCLISAAFVTFIGVSTEEARDRTMKNWLDLCHLPSNFRVVSFLSAETEQLTWKEKGIPSSIIALENASIIFNNTQTAFVVDPTGKVSAFLAEYFKSNVQVLKGSQHDYLTQVELGVRFGKTLVIEDVDDIEPALIPLLREEFSHQGPRTVVQLGEKQIDLNEKFKLFLCSKNEQIRLPEYIQSAVSVVNFSTTKSGLASQLLSLAIEIERPELEKRSSQLVSQAEVLKIQLDQLEQRLLDELANSEGSLLENTQLLASLNSSKENAEKIATSLGESEQLQRELDKERNAYQQFVQKCSQLYFGINQLHNRNHVYNFNVSTIINIFKRCFAENREDQNSASRLDTLYRQLQFRVFDTVSRAMFKADRLMFAMEFIHIAQPSAFQPNEWEVFLGQLITESGENFGRWAAWIPESRRNDVARLQVHLPTLFHTLNLDDQQNWASFASSSECEDTFPTLVESRLTPFQKVLIVQAIRPDRLHSCMSKFAAQMLGVKSLNISLDLQRIYKFDSSPKEPILIFIGAGADPSQELKEFSDKVIGVGRFHQHAMGKGIDRAVLDNLRQCASKGDWLCLTNVHLVADSAMRIIQELSQCAAQDVFRLWLVAEPDDHFTTVFLQECLKLTYEAPPGLKNNLQRTYTQWIQNEPSNLGTDAVDVDVKLKAMFVLGWLHAMVQERRTYIPQGWWKFYEFCTADIKAGRHALDYLFQISMKSPEPDWEAFRGLMRDTIYGGRVENELDLGALQAYLSSYFNSRMITKGRELIISHDLKLPQLGSLQDYLTWITSSFPPENLPLLLGLPRNISFSWEISQSNETITQLRQLKQMGQLMSRSGSGFSRELWTQELTPLLNLWKKLNQNSTLIGRDIESQHGNRNQADPFAEVLELEFSYAKKQVHKVHTDLTTISKSIKGTITPDMRIINLAREMLAHEIPESWDTSWTGTSNLREYMDQLVMKAKYVQSLRESSQRRSLLEDKSLDLAQLFRPTALLNALRQFTARKKGSSMERLKLTISWQASQLSAEITLTLAHLQIQGALFDGRELRSVGQTSPALSSVPPLSIAWVDEGAQNVAQQKSIVDVPLFTNMQRNVLITEVQMPCASETRDSWIIAGVALFLA